MIEKLNSSKQLSSSPEANNETSPRPSTKATRLQTTFLFYDNIFQKREESREATPKLQSYKNPILTLFGNWITYGQIKNKAKKDKIPLSILSNSLKKEGV